MPSIECLPEEQRRLWPELRAVPDDFVLYGGTALALRLGHRQSIDFDFFSASPFAPEVLQRRLPFAATAEVLQKSENTLSLRTSGPLGVRLSFFGGLSFGQMEAPDQCSGNLVFVAGLKDLFATKLNTVYQRAEAKDYLDIDALVRSGCSLAIGLACARAIYGNGYNPMLPLKALTFFEDGDLPRLSSEVRMRLIEAVDGVTELPIVTLRSHHISTR